MIYRTQVPDVGITFKAPREVTFGYQHERGAFSVWHKSGDAEDCHYIVLGTGHRYSGTEGSSLVASVVMPDGFHVFHLIRLT
jgi:hypothetical protein